MVQMTVQDQAIVKAIPGNNQCADCGMKSPQWASVSFGNVFCLECSGVHRSLGVHISFVRSIAMDSWTDKQLAAMKTGGNDKCNQYLKSKGIDPRTPIKQKYENDHAQLYKEILKARIEGRPEPTSLPRKPASAPPSVNRSMPGISGGGGGAGDPNGMERMAGETDAQYVARQTRLRDEARARMAAKFGGGGARMGGVGSSGMQGIGSNSNYNPNAGGYDNVVGSMTSAFSSGLNIVGGAASSVSSSVSSFVTDDQARSTVANLGSTASNVAGSFWSSLSAAASDVAKVVTQPDEGDGLAALQKEFSAHKPAQSKYAGFGNSANSSSFGSANRVTSGSSMGSSVGSAPSTGGGSLQEAPGLPGEDRNGMERLTGETDEQYVIRQTRLRDEAKARMAAKFGSGGLSSASSSAPRSGGFGGTPAPPSSGGFGAVPQAPPSGGGMGMQLQSRPAPAPRSGGMAVATPPQSGSFTPPRKNSKDSLSGDDFFASFGT